MEWLKTEANKTLTENGAITHRSTLSDCLDLFATIGALRNASEEEILVRFARAYAEDRDIALKILFFARDIRGGLGERNTFRVILSYLACDNPAAVIKNIELVANYGRFDDLLVLLGTPCESALISYIGDTLKADLEALKSDANVSLLAKWLPSVNASNKESAAMAKAIARKLNLTEKEYRKILSGLRRRINIIENNLREMDYSFKYENQPSKALLKYRKAFLRNDNEHYKDFLSRASKDSSLMHTGTLAPYDIIAPITNRNRICEEERRSLDTTWNALENYAGSDNALVVVDGSGSMYYSERRSLPAAVAQSLAIYFAERNTGAFKNHFITFSSNPKLIEIKGRDIVEKVKYCMRFDECSNTNLAKTFELILKAALKKNLSQEDMPEKLYIISDMEFDCMCDCGDMTNFEYAKKLFEDNGYKLPKVIFWNVASRNNQQPVTMNEQGVALVSGCSPVIFNMLKSDDFDPYSFMMEVVSSERYSPIAA